MIDPSAETLRPLEPDRPKPHEASTEGNLGAGDSQDRGAPAAVLPRGSTVGRYVVLDMLGRGGMGVVFAAYDPELDRKVAIKLVRYAQCLGSVGAAARNRLLREAQSLAKLSHRNIVSVYDVGEHEDSIFVAMEFIEGTTLAAWADRRRDDGRPPSWREVLEIYIPAGHALAAAHRAGIIHRDFKPDNVMIDGTGRVVVLDFGLARPSRFPGPDDAEHVGGSAAMPLAMQLSVAGAVMGTPAYMSPEQFAGQPTDATTDQFSFCVSLYAALYGERPFGGASFAELAASILGQPIRAAPKGARVPLWLRKAVERGLSRERGDRHPSMDALLDALSADPGRSRRRIGLVGLAVASLGAVTWRAGVTGIGEDRCTEITETFERTWGPERRAAIQAAFRTDPRSYSEDALSRVEAELDDRGAHWIALRTSACVASRDVTRAATEARIRAICLDGQLRRLDGITRMLADADQSMVVRAVAVLETLPAPEHCEDTTADRSPPPVPDDPSTQERVEEVRTRALDIPTLVDLGRVEEATRLGAELLGLAREIGFLPLVGEVAAALGRAYGQFGRYDEALSLFEEAALIARGERHETLGREAVRGLVFLHSTYTGRHDLAQWLMRDWEAMLGGARERPIVRAHLAMSRALLARERERHADAAVAAEESVALLEAAGEERINLVIFMDNLANLYIRLGRLDDALEVLGRARVVADEAVGPTHPLQGDLLRATAQIRASQARHDESMELLRRALAIYQSAYGEVHPYAAAMLNGLGLELENVGRANEALAALRRAHRIQHESGGADHPQAFVIATNLGNILRRLGHADEAVPLHRDVLAARLRRGEADDESLLQLRDNLADDLRLLDRCAEAEPEYRIAIEGRERTHGPEGADIAYPLIGLGLCRLRANDLVGAQASLERAVTLVDENPDHHQTAGTAHLALAMAVRRAKGAAATVDGHVDRARAHLSAEPIESAALLATLDRFVAGDEIVDLVY